MLTSQHHAYNYSNGATDMLTSQPRARHNRVHVTTSCTSQPHAQKCSTGTKVQWIPESAGLLRTRHNH